MTSGMSDQTEEEWRVKQRWLSLIWRRICFNPPGFYGSEGNGDPYSSGCTSLKQCELLRFKTTSAQKTKLSIRIKIKRMRHRQINNVTFGECGNDGDRFRMFYQICFCFFLFFSSRWRWRMQQKSLVHICSAKNKHEDSSRKWGSRFRIIGAARLDIFLRSL